MSEAAVLNRVRRSFYLDSVALMRLSQEVTALPGVEAAALMIGTPSNKQVLADAGLLADAGSAAGASDLVVALRATSREAADAALGRVDALLKRRPPSAETAGAWRPKTLDGAAQALPDANLAMVSVPGAFAAAEAAKALRRGLHVMVFSDNVRVEDERALKLEARDRGLLLMGPDCGTALIAGTPLAFANQVPAGGIGIVAASGTGLQEVSCLIARAGRGVSHGIGVGSRDLSDAVGGVMTLMAIDALDEDPGTERIVLISKPPAVAVAERILARIARSPKPFTVCFVGLAGAAVPGNARLAATLQAAAEDALGGPPIEVPAATRKAVRAAAAVLGPDRRWVHGLYCGGTLCAEAQVVLREAGAAVRSNAPVPGALPDGDGEAPSHRVLDLGAEVFTRGRPHPMIEPVVRTEALRRSLAAADVAAILLDVVIGFGAHRDAAGAVAEALAHAPAERPAVVASVTGTEGDPQVRSAQVRKLRGAGVIVAPSNAWAARLALEAGRRRGQGRR